MKEPIDEMVKYTKENDLKEKGFKELNKDWNDMLNALSKKKVKY